jgi:hypothetical protein
MGKVHRNLAGKCNSCPTPRAPVQIIVTDAKHLGDRLLDCRTRYAQPVRRFGEVSCRSSGSRLAGVTDALQTVLQHALTLPFRS